MQNNNYNKMYMSVNYSSLLILFRGKKQSHGLASGEDFWFAHKDNVMPCQKKTTIMLEAPDSPSSSRSYAGDGELGARNIMLCR